MGSYDRDRVPPVFMDHGARDYGMDLTQTELDAEALDERPSRSLTPPHGTTAPRAASSTAPSGLTDLSPTSDRRAGSFPDPLPAPNPQES